MESGTAIAIGLVMAGGLGVAAYAVSKKDSADTSAQTALTAERARTEQLQYELQQQRYAAQQQPAAAPAQAAPTQQGQRAGGGVASAVDGLLQIISLFG